MDGGVQRGGRPVSGNLVITSRIQSPLDRVVNCCVRGFVRASDLQRVIAALDDVQRRRRVQPPEHRLQLGWRTERVSLPLHDQHGPLHVAEVSVAQLVRPARRVQRIPKQHDSIDGQRPIRRGHVRRDTSAHRLATDEQMLVGARDRFARARDHLRIAHLEHRLTIGNPAALLHVGKIEREDIDAERRECLRERHHERAALSDAGAVSENQRDAEPGCSGGVGERGDRARPGLHRQFVRAFQAPPALPLRS
jgi:hypothetical protein